jgi:hypothetical protein
MNKEGALLFILADKLNGYDEDDIRMLCQDTLCLSEPESLEVTSRALLRRVQPDTVIRHKILKLISSHSLIGGDTEFTRRIAGAIRSVQTKNIDLDKGRQAVA